MSKLSKEELLEWLEQAHKYFTFEPPGKDKQAYQQIKELIQKPEVTEEWVEEKANWLFKKSWVPISIDRAKDFIRSLVEDVHVP